MTSTTPNSPTAQAAQSVSGSLRSTPGPATRTPVHLGLVGNSSSLRQAGTTPRRTVPSLSIRTADGSCVSILNDHDVGAAAHGSTCEHKRCQSVPGLLPGCSAGKNSPFRAQSTPGAATPQPLPAMLPSLSTLVQAVRMVSSDESPALRRSISSSSTCSHGPVPPPRSAPEVSATPAYAPAGTKTTGKRKYKCSFDGCGKAFTTSGHLARHQRIHTGEKNFSCLFPGCSSRFSRQDNMMQHYRTHLSSKSRRNASPRKVVFVEQPGDPFRRPASGLYSSQVFAGSHPIQHHQQHHPYGPPPMSASPMRSHARAPVSSSAGRSHYGLPSSVHMPRGPTAMPGPTAPPRNFSGGLSKHSPAVAHPGSMAFY